MEGEAPLRDAPKGTLKLPPSNQKHTYDMLWLLWLNYPAHVFTLSSSSLQMPLVVGYLLSLARNTISEP